MTTTDENDVTIPTGQSPDEGSVAPVPAVTQAAAASTRMHVTSDETAHAVDLILARARERLLTDPPLGGTTKDSDLLEFASGALTEQGIGVQAALGIFADVLSPACVAADHPGYLSFIPAAPTKTATAFDMLVSASAVFGGFWRVGSGAIFAENQVLDWLAREFGLPPGAGGTFVQGGTQGNLSALVAARESARRSRARLGLSAPARWAIIASADAHSSVRSVARIMDVDVVPVRPSSTGALEAGSVREALDSTDVTVFAVVATAGSTNFGTVDDIASIAALKDEYTFWLHVDGAYGLAGMLSPVGRPLFAGVERADSLIVDPHKWLFAPFDACALIYRDPEEGRRAHTQRAEYLDAVTQTADWSAADYAVHLTRRARGLPLWFSLATHGAGAYRDAVTACIELAREIADEINLRPHLRLVRDPQLSIVVFERIGWTQDDYDSWAALQLSTGRALVTPSSHNSVPNLRLAIINPLTTRELLLELLDSMS
ncbi:aspartate aminotransferase family protein [Cryobacterium sp. 1639]|nr:aspartate aminotransferase family protein [Cryobacterium sp. 1639]